MKFIVLMTLVLVSSCEGSTKDCTVSALAAGREECREVVIQELDCFWYRADRAKELDKLKSKLERSGEVAEVSLEGACDTTLRAESAKLTPVIAELLVSKLGRDVGELGIKSAILCSSKTNCKTYDLDVLQPRPLPMHSKTEKILRDEGLLHDDEDPPQN